MKTPTSIALIFLLVAMPGVSGAQPADLSQRLDHAFATLYPDAAARQAKARRCAGLLQAWNQGQPAVTEQALAALRDQRQAPPITERSGVGLVVLVDTSGSMSAPPAGGGKSKIDTANSAVSRALSLVQRFHEVNPRVTLSVGVTRFAAAVKVVLPLGPVRDAAPEIPRLQAEGGTAIGMALISAKAQLDQARIRHQHILLITDGMSTEGVPPLPVLQAFNLLSKEAFPILHFVAFDVAAERFAPMQRLFLRQVHQAGSAQQLDQVIESLLQQEVLVESGG